jgi:hypothetical protein
MGFPAVLFTQAYFTAAKVKRRVALGIAFFGI